MERDVFRALAGILRRLGRRRRTRRERYTDATVLEVYLWAVLNHKPVVWACDRANWPRGLRRGALPSQSRVSRRLRSPAVAALLARLCAACVQERHGVLDSAVRVIDGKALTIPLHSADRQAGTGRGVGHIAKGYKMHVVVDAHGRFERMRLAALNVDEREMARRMVRDLPAHVTHLVGDSFYDSNTLHEACARRRVQLLAPRRTPGVGLGSRPQQPARLTAIAALETPAHPDLRRLHRRRFVVEHFFAWLTLATGGLTPHVWVRGYRTTKRWITAKLAIAHIRKTAKQQTAPRQLVA